MHLERLGPYQISAFLDRGATSRVYRAVDLDDPARTPVALKVLDTEQCPTLEHRVRFLNEAFPIKDLRHPGLPLIHRIDPGAPPYIAMELCDGSLASRCANGALPVAEVLDLAAQLAAVLAYLHPLGVVHRDLKPHNVLFARPTGETSKPVVKLVDFGQAKFPRDGVTTVSLSTVAGSSAGTPTYCAPEQWLDARSVGGAADVYSVGILMHQCLGGAPPFQDERRGHLRLQHLCEPPPPLPGVAPALAALVRRLLDKDPARRPSAAALAEELAALAL